MLTQQSRFMMRFTGILMLVHMAVPFPLWTPRCTAVGLRLG